jgi:hypothetical protein
MATELLDIIQWALEEFVPSFENLPVLRTVLSLKHISRATVRPYVALVWLKNYTHNMPS